MTHISNELKKECLKRKAGGESYKQIYVSLPEGAVGASLKNFSRMMRKWAHKVELDEELLEGANLGYNFKPYASSVHVDGKGRVTGAWIKQTALEQAEAWEEFIKEVAEKPLPILTPTQAKKDPVENLLEIPLFDMHFGVTDIEYYSETLERVLSVIRERYYEEIVIIIGQDLLHNDDFRGRTTKGTPIDKADMKKAWQDAETFFVNVINASQNNASRVRVIYSRGNHDESMSWAFTKLLERIFPDVSFDTDMLPRKAMNWKRCFIGWTHGEYAVSKAQDLFAQFALEFPIDFAGADAREIHTGHLHREGDKDVGAMVRRLPTGNKTDEWSRDQGYVGAHKRFVLFTYEPGRLSSVRYL